MLEKRENTVNCHLFSHVLLKCTFNQAEPKNSTKLKCYMKILICSAKIDMGKEGYNISIIVKLPNIVGPKPVKSRSFLLP